MGSRSRTLLQTSSEWDIDAEPLSGGYFSSGCLKATGEGIESTPKAIARLVF
jgi:hypothetical protein